jgi:putative copper export protein
MGVAGINKLMLVPRIVSEGNTVKLRASIRYEMLVATMILLMTSYLSTVIGPPEH